MDPNWNWTDFLSSLGILLTPIVVAAIGWMLSQKWKRDEQKWKKDERLHPDRLKVYDKCLEPLVLAFVSKEAWLVGGAKKKYPKAKDGVSAALSVVHSIEYRQNANMLMLIGTDEVVTSYNNLMQHFYSSNDRDYASGMKGIEMLGTLILEIRKSVAEDATRLDNWDMLEWFITDARQMRKQSAQAE